MNENDNKLKEDDFENNIDIIKKKEDDLSTKKEKEYFENTCLNLRKILHILEL